MLDENKQELGQFSQQNPLKFGFLKQKAKDLGLSTQEFIEQFADRIMKQVQQDEQPKANNDLTEIKELLKEQTKVIMVLAQKQAAPAPTAQPTNPFGMIKDFTDALKGMRAYENEVITGFKAIQSEIIENLGSDEPTEPLNPIDTLFQKLAEKAINENLQQPKPINEVRNMNIDEIIAKTPLAYQEKIKAGLITLEQAKEDVKMAGIPVSDLDIEAAFKKIRELK